MHKGAEVNAQDALGQTPLHRAAQRGHKKAVNFLLFSGANATTQDQLEQTAADMARSEKHEDVYTIVLKAIHKREKEILEERKKQEKILERQRKKERKQQEKLEKEKPKKMERQRSLSLDGGLQNADARKLVEEKKGNRLSFVKDAFGKRDLNSSEEQVAAKTKISKSTSLHDKGDQWLKYINGDMENLTEE